MNSPNTKKPKTACCDYSGELPTKMGGEFDRLANLIGEFMEYWGFKKIHGQIWTHVFLSAAPVDASTLVKRLRVSKALVSLAIKDLVHYNVIQTCAKGQRRTVYFQANPEIMKVITDVLMNRERKMLDQIQLALSGLQKPAPEGVCKDKVLKLNDMVCDASDFLDVMISADMHVEAIVKN